MARGNFGDPLPGQYDTEAKSTWGDSRWLAATVAAGLFINIGVIAVPLPAYAEDACPGVDPRPEQYEETT